MATLNKKGIGSVVLVGTLMQIAAIGLNPGGFFDPTPSAVTPPLQVAMQTVDRQPTPTAQIVSGPVAVAEKPANSARTQVKIGINLGGIADWSTQWPFVDVFKTSRAWLAQRDGAGWGEGGQLRLTPEGWIAALEPGQFAETIMMTGTEHYPKGRYTLLYDGEGKIAFRYDNAKILSQTPGRMVVQVDPSDRVGVFLQIRETNPRNPVRNLRFIMPGFEQTYKSQPFHPVFLQRLAKFRSLRLMDWMATNHSEVVNWSDRTTLNSARQAGAKGVALEYLIQLANTLKIDPWFTIPAKASDDYVRQFATMVRDRLDPSLTARFEYSNEVWNTAFSQHRYAAQQGRARNLDSNDYTAAIRYYSERAVEVFKIVDQVFGPKARQRVERVLAGQADNAWTGEEILRWKDAYKQADAYAIAPYFDGLKSGKGWLSDLNQPNRVDATLQMSPGQIVENLKADIAQDIKPMLDKNYAVATKRFNLPLYAYEGGPHLTAYQFPDDKVERVTELFAQVNRHPEMRTVYRAYLNQWQQSGGVLFSQFVDVAKPGKWGFWGALEYQNQDPSQAPKYQGLMDYMQANPPR